LLTGEKEKAKSLLQKYLQYSANLAPKTQEEIQALSKGRDLAQKLLAQIGK
jgi:hypothetical protein